MRILVVGTNGQVGYELCKLAEETEYDWICLNRAKLDITSKENIEEVISKYKPKIVINAAAYTAVDNAETDKEIALAVNSNGPKYIAIACEKIGSAFIHISTDYVFNGEKKYPYSETDDTFPTSYYGFSKLLGEQNIIKNCKKHIILRTSWVFGEHGNNFVKTMLRLAKNNKKINIVADQYGAPTSAKGIAKTILTIAEKIMIEKTNWGIYHYTGYPKTNWFGFAEAIFEQALIEGVIYNEIDLKPIVTSDYPTAAKRPENSVLSNEKIKKEFNIIPDDWLSRIKENIKDFS